MTGNHQLLDHPVELVNIVRPGICLRQFHAVRFKTDDLFAQLGVEFAQIERKQTGNICGAAAQGRQIQGKAGVYIQ